MTLPNLSINLHFPGDSKLLMGILVADAIHHDLSDYLRSLSIDDLRVIAVHIAGCEPHQATFAEQLGLPAGDGPTWWVSDVLPKIKAEIYRRNRPKHIYSDTSPISKLKQLDLVEVAGKYTQLKRAGPGKLKGRCPLHQEKSASFYVFIESQRWKCFGVCGAGGDVISLLRALKARVSS